MAVIWSTALIQQYANDGENYIAAKVTPIFHRFSLSIVSGTGTYALPSYVQKVLFVTWKGSKLDPLSQVDLQGANDKYRTEEGTPRWYSWSSDGLMVLRLYPVPNVTIAADDTNVYGSDIANRVIVSCFRSPDQTQSTFQIPNYIARRTVKSFVGWRAFRSEGEGQNLKMSQYHKARFDFLMLKYEMIKNKYYSSKNLSINGATRLVRQKARLSDDFTITG
jgi:hypothetical protein